jgi:hypothetical protein
MGLTSDEGKGIGSFVTGGSGGFLSGLTGLATGGMSTLIPGIAGALGGLFGQTSSQQKIMQGPTATGIAGEQAVLQNLSKWQDYVNAGPGMQDVQAGIGSQRDLASMLQNYAQGGFLPGQSDWDTASQFSSRAFRPQEVALNQAHGESTQRMAQLAAQMGRPVNDPILQAKLAQERSQGMERLGASRSAYEAEFAQNLPMQRLGFMGQLSDLRGQLASQAMSNRQAMVSAGSNLEQVSNNFRLAGAGLSTTQGGGIRDMITGGFAGYGAGLRNQALEQQMGFNKGMYEKAMSQKPSSPYIQGGGFGGGMQQQGPLPMFMTQQPLPQAQSFNINNAIQYPQSNVSNVPIPTYNPGPDTSTFNVGPYAIPSPSRWSIPSWMSGAFSLGGQ